MSPAMEPAALSILTWRLPLTLNSYVTTVSSLPPSPYIPKDSAKCCSLLQNFYEDEDDEDDAEAFSRSRMMCCSVTRIAITIVSYSGL